MKMDYSTIAKYAAAAALLGSVYVLVWFALIEPAQFYNLVLMCLGALGITTMNGSNK